MSGNTIVDGEIVFRRIPPGTNWFEPPDRATTGNFKLDRRQGELGLSVNRQAIVSAAEVLNKPGTLPGSGVASAAAGVIRELADAAGTPLLLDVIAIDDVDDPGHAEIRGPTPGRLSPAASKALRDVFELIVLPRAVS